VTFVTLTI